MNSNSLYRFSTFSEYFIYCNLSQLILNSWEKKMRTDYQRRYKYIEMTQNDRTIAKYLTVDLMTGWAVYACQDKY